MRLWMALLALLLPGCGGDDQNGNPSPKQYGSFIKVNVKDPSAVLNLPPMILPTSAPIDTGSSLLCSTNHDQPDKYCVIVGTTITVAQGATFRAYGTKPLILLATTTFDLEGTLDVSSKHDGSATQAGAGALPASACPNTTAATVNSGGFGGSFMGKGGDGGAVDGAKGTAAPGLTAPPSMLRGGCPGGNGSTATAGSTAGVGGAGGGAVTIIAGKITVNGTIDASGAGGGGGPAQKSGGGGGGSGGMIVLDALNESAPPNVAVGSAQTIWLYANGGGGGQGGTGGTLASSGPGDDGKDPSNPMVQALGGRNFTRDGGRGGSGSAGSVQLDGDPALSATNNGGGGAGGGGAGFIHAPTMQGALVAPPTTYP